MTEKVSKKRDLSLLLLIGGIVLGAIIGLVFGEKATVLKPLGDIFLNLMFTIVAPMVLVSISTAVGNMIDMKRLGKILTWTMLIFVVTGLFAGIVSFGTLNIFNIVDPGSMNFEMAAEQGVEIKSAGDMVVETLTVSDFPEILSRKNMLAIIVFSIMLGLAVSKNGGKDSLVGKLLNNLNNVIMTIISFIMKLAPIGLGAYFANLVGEFGPELIGNYGRLLAVYYPLIIIYVVIFFPLYAYFAGGKIGVRKMSKNIIKPMVTSFATQSSVATLPVNKNACNNIGVSEDISDIILPLGCTMHMDGSVISSIFKIAFLFGIYGIPYTGIDVYAKSMMVAILSAFVLSGAPGGGLVGEMLIVSLFNFPPESFPIIATIGFLVDPAATMANASGDTIASMMVTRIVEGKNWIRKKDVASE